MESIGTGTKDSGFNRWAVWNQLEKKKTIKRLGWQMHGNFPGFYFIFIFPLFFFYLLLLHFSRWVSLVDPIIIIINSTMPKKTSTTYCYLCGSGEKIELFIIILLFV